MLGNMTASTLVGLFVEKTLQTNTICLDAAEFPFKAWGFRRAPRGDNFDFDFSSIKES